MLRNLNLKLKILIKKKGQFEIKKKHIHRNVVIKKNAKIW